MILKYLNGNQKNLMSRLSTILEERKIAQKNKSKKVNKIIQNVKIKGDKALIFYEKKFSRIKTKKSQIKFTKNEINKISRNIDRNLKKSIDLAYNRIISFHKKQNISSFKFRDKFKNELSYIFSPIEEILRLLLSCNKLINLYLVHLHLFLLL